MHNGPIRRATLSACPLLAASAGTLAALVSMRPQLAGPPVSWRGDDLAFATAWLLAVVCAVWLTVTTAACLAAMTRGHLAFATRVAGWAPPIARGFLQGALISTWAVVPTAAHAATAPLVLHVGPGGRLASVPGAPAPGEIPVVRAAPATSTTTDTTTTAAVTPRTPPTTRPSATPPPAILTPSLIPREVSPDPAPTVRAPAAPRSSPPGVYVVRAGDNLWQIAEREVARSTQVARPDDHAVAEYWQRVSAANRSTLRSGDPSLIFPGELIDLPS